jgi:hypothetical protein
VINLASPDKTCTRFSFHFPTRTVYRLLLGTIQNTLNIKNWKGKGEFYPRKGLKNAERNKGIDKILDLVRCLSQISAALIPTMVFVTHCAVN